MNYYEHHIGDFAKDAGYLSMIEEGAYRRLIDAYYTRERPLPADLKECCKLARAATKVERDAVAYVLKEFFDLHDDGHRQKRCDEEIERYLDAEPDREAKRTSERDRQRRSRERRKVLFEQLRSHEVVPAWDTKTADLEALLSRVTSTGTSRTSHAPVTRDNTATHFPVPNTQYPNNNPAAIARTWWPSPETIADLHMVHGYAEPWIDQQVPSFVAYWADRNEPRTSFDALFIDHCQVKAKSLRSVS
jgi:uncharacterized protein YdaU (DUF1376 family)